MDREPIEEQPRRRMTLLAVALGGIAILLLMLWFSSSDRDPDQDKLTGPQTSQIEPGEGAGRCAGNAVYGRIKMQLFERAAQGRTADQEIFAEVARAASVRMENPVMESEDSANRTANCSGTLSIDLPPGTAAAGGRKTITGAIDYQVDESGTVAIVGGEGFVNLLSTVGRLAEVPEVPADAATEVPEDPLMPLPGADPPPPTAPAAPRPRPLGARPSFNCDAARTHGEIEVCGDAGLAGLDRTMAARYQAAMAVASPDQRALLRQTRDRFLSFRDRCPTRACMGDAYTGRIREIRDIMEGRWQPPR